MDRQLRSYHFRMHTTAPLAPQKKMTITEKNNRNYKEAWANVPIHRPGPVDCEYEHPITGKCMSHYDYQVWVNQHRK